MSHVKLYYHLIFATKHRQRVIGIDHCDDMYRFLIHLFKEHECVVYQINGDSDHIHVCLYIPPTKTVADVIRDVKRISSGWARQCGLFPGFIGWNEGYGLFTLSESHRQAVIEYIKRQKEHHKSVPFEDEYKRVLERYGIEYDPRYPFG